MGFLANKKILLTGLLSNRSIAYGIASSALREGATLAYTYAGDKFKDRVESLVQELGGGLVMPCDVTSDEQIEGVFATLGKEWGALDGIVHAIAYAPAEALKGDFLEGASREAFRISHDVSSYSLAALAKGGRSLMQGRKGAIVTMTYLGAERSVTNYNLMGLAKASLEANVRYLAACLGPEEIRVNGVSAGPIKTLAAAGIAGFSKILHHVAANAPLRRNVTTNEVGDATAFLLSDLASAITGEVLHVDCGYSTVAVGLGAE
jgi:enoyl-[acyl-carrier protein] reductase I